MISPDHNPPQKINKKYMIAAIIITAILTSTISLYISQVNAQTSYTQGLNDGAGRGYVIRDPSYAEMTAFIASDRTNLNTYSTSSYECFDFASDVCNNAFKEGYKCGLTYLEFPKYTHALVCFNTTDRGLIFVEPQTDEIMTVKVGIHYWHTTQSYDDTIVYYSIVW